MTERPAGAAGFDDTYWRENYGEPDRMDGVANAGAHAAYLKASFDVVMQPVQSVADLGFGLGHLFDAVLQAFRPFKALGIEPSPSAFDAFRYRQAGVTGTRLRLEHIDLLSWCRHPDHPRLRHDLAVCTSVWQYLEDDELVEVVPVLAERFRWVYLTVPTEEELEQQVRDEQFHDRWAIRRPRAWYRDLLAPHFTVVGARLLESRVSVAEADSPFTDHLYRWG